MRWWVIWLRWWPVVDALQAATGPGVVIHLDENHTKAIKPYVEKKIRLSPITGRSDEGLLELLEDV